MKIKPVVPFEPISTDIFPDGNQWTAQIKWDGTRVLTYFDGFNTRLFNRKLNERTFQYPELTEIKTYCTAKSIILDGEVIALENGKPSFYQIMKRDRLTNHNNIQAAKKQIPITYMIFDVLYYDNNWLISKTLEYRQAILNKIIEPNQHVQIVPTHQDGLQLFGLVKEYDLEGIVLKDINSTYGINAKDKRWQKKKLTKDLIAVIGGVTKRDGIVNSLLLGLYDSQGNLWYIGHAGAGKLKNEDWRTLTEKIEKIKVDSMTFINLPERAKDITWVTPVMTAKINYLEWTPQKTLRQPSIQGFVSIPPHECQFSN